VEKSQIFKITAYSPQNDDIFEQMCDKLKLQAFHLQENGKKLGHIL
jgi:hypothetical protein